MSILRSVLVLGLAVGLAGVASAAPSGGRGRHRGAVAGIVVRVNHTGGARGTGLIEIRPGRHRRRAARTAAAGSGTTLTFAVNPSTRFVRPGPGVNGQGNGGRLSLANVRPGEWVRIYPGSGGRRVARRVDILANGPRHASHRGRKHGLRAGAVGRAAHPGRRHRAATASRPGRTRAATHKPRAANRRTAHGHRRR